jgi:hypothetical protein
MNYSRQAIKYDIISSLGKYPAKRFEYIGFTAPFNMSEQPACYIVETMTDYLQPDWQPVRIMIGGFTQPAQIERISPFFRSIMLTWLLP